MTAIRLGLLTMSLGFLLHGTAVSHAAEIDRTRAAGVMAAFLRHIANFATWPEEETLNAGQTIQFGLIGADPNGVIQLIAERTESGGQLLAKGRPIRVVVPNQPGGEHADIDTLSDCALLFISEGSEDQWALVAQQVQQLPIVTVSEMPGFVDHGGMVEYFVERRTGKVRMKVNLQAARDAGISFSSNFLSLDSVIPLEEPEETR